MKKTSPGDIAKMDSLKLPQKGNPPKQSTGSIPITVRFNAGEESLDDIFQSFHSGGGDSLSSSPSAQNQHPQSPEEVNQRNNFLQGNFFNRKSVISTPHQQHQQHQGATNKPQHQQLSPNHPSQLQPQESNSPYNGSQQLSPSASGGGGLSPNKYRRSISFPQKGSSPTPGYSLDVNSGGGGSGDGYLYQDQHRNGCGPPSSMDMRPMDHSLNDIIRNMGGGGGGGDGGTIGLVSRPGPVPILKNNSLGVGIGDHITDEAGNNFILDGSGCFKLNNSASPQGSEVVGRYSRKVFVGGLPPDIDEDEITTSFRRFGPLVVDWPHKAESKSYFPPKGYAFLLFQDENSVQQLIESCITDEEKLYLCVSSPTIKDKPVQIRPWRLTDADFVLDATMPLDPRKTVFVGGVPRPLKAFELAMIMDRLYGGVCYAGIDTDPELKYPKGAGRVAFANQQSYIAAISARFVQLQHGDIDKRVEVKPYVLDDQMCDECEGQRCGGKFAPFFCANVTCLQYYCEHCWAAIHSRPGREYHKPLVKEGADRPRAVPFRWC